MHKIATCCYCGTRAALVLRGEGRHELACSACGAPLHELKAIPMPRGDAARGTPAAQSRGRGPSRPVPVKAPVKVRPRRRAHEDEEDDDERRRAPRRRRSGGRFLRKALEEIWDAVEDIID